MNRATRCAALALTLFAAGARHGHAHDHPPGPNGGRVEDAGKWHAELVTRAEAVAVYLSDGDGTPLPVDGFKAVAVLKSGSRAVRIPLAPDGATANARFD
ncbi:MAG: hypothetical protein PGN25_17000 [Methylorubrum populi]